MNKKIGLLFLLVMLGLQIKAQVLTGNEIIGTWKVAKIQVLTNEVPKGQSQTMEMVKNSFLKSRFTFKSDKNFSFDFSFDEMRIKNGHWKYNTKTNTYIIQEWKDKETNKSKLMEIFAKKDGDKIIFQLSETFFAFEMVREK